MPTRRGSGRSTVRPPGRALHATLKSEELAHSAQSDALSGGESKQQHALPGLLRLPRVAAPSPGLLRRPPGTAPWTRIGARRRAQGWRLRGSSQARRWHPRPGTYGVGHPKSQMLSSKDHVATPITSGSGHRRRHPRNICAAIPYAADTSGTPQATNQPTSAPSPQPFAGMAERQVSGRLSHGAEVPHRGISNLGPRPLLSRVGALIAARRSANIDLATCPRIAAGPNAAPYLCGPCSTGWPEG